MLGFYVLEGKFNLLDYVYFFGFVKMAYTALKWVDFDDFDEQIWMGY